MKHDKNKRKKEDLSAAIRVIGRIIKDTRPILPSLILAAVISLASILLSMLAPELIGTLTDGIYEYVTLGVPMDRSRIIELSVLLLISYLASGVLSIITMIIMNNTVSRHYTCRIRVDMSAKISKIPIKKVDTTPNGEIISRMTNDVSIMG